MNLKPLYCGLALFVVISAGAAQTPEFSLGDALSGQTMPLTFKPSYIPGDFRAVKICQAGTGQVFGMNAVEIPKAPMGAAASMFLEILPISWTNGKMVTIAGETFLVTYGVDLGPNTLKAMTGAKKVPSFSLRLRLIKTTEIGSITPLPEWNKSKYLRAMAQIVIPSSTRFAVNTPVLSTSVTPNLPTKPMVSEPKPFVSSSVPPVAATPNNNVTAQPGTTVAPQNPSVTPQTITVTPKNTEPTAPSAVKGIATERPVDAALYEQGQQNARSVASAMLVYAQDYDGTFPYVQSYKGAEYVLYPYVKGLNVYQTMNPIHGGEFRFNMCLAGVKMSDVTEPSVTPLFYDTFAWPNGTFLVAFADSHVRFLTSEQWDSVKKYLNLKLKANGKPLPADLELPASGSSTPAPADTSKPAGGN